MAMGNPEQNGGFDGKMLVKNHCHVCELIHSMDISMEFI
jgi:hypothetical protein